MFEFRVSAVLCGLLAVAGCVDSEESSTASCAEGAQSIKSSDGRTLCVELETQAQAPFSTGFFAPARVNHQVTLEDSDGNPIDIDTDQVITGISHHPMMYMNNGHEHTTPHLHEPNTDASAQGIYTLVAYYSMASMGANGMAMGEWEYNLYLTDAGKAERAKVSFTPDVMMVTGGVFAAKASNAGDTWTNMMGVTKPRNFTVWLNGLEAGTQGGYDLSVFVSTEDMMHGETMDGHAGASFPAVYVGQSLHGPVPEDGGMQTSLSIDTVVVEVSLDAGQTWQSLSADGHGAYSGSGLTDFTAGEQTELSVKLSVNGLEMQTAEAAYPQLMFTTP